MLYLCSLEDTTKDSERDEKTDSDYVHRPVCRAGKG